MKNQRIKHKKYNNILSIFDINDLTIKLKENINIKKLFVLD